MQTHITIPYFYSESGTTFTNVVVDHASWGTLNADRSNVVIVLPALTGNVDAASWWSGIIGPGRVIDTDTYYVVCMRPRYEDICGTAVCRDESGRPLPILTSRDVVALYRAAADALGIGRIGTLIGGSLGGQHVLEWCVQEPERVDHAVCIATNAVHSPWGRAFNAAQRMALEADPTFGTSAPGAGGRGLAAARSIGMISYRTYADFEQKQPDSKADSYLRYQGEKLVKRFDPLVYYHLTHIMDSHDVGRDRGGSTAALSRVTCTVTSIGIDSDLLFPTHEQQHIAHHVMHGTYYEMRSPVGHDAFLADQLQLSSLLTASLPL